MGLTVWNGRGENGVWQRSVKVEEGDVERKM